MEIERTLRIGRTVIEVYFAEQIIHLFDHDIEGTQTLTNAIDANYLNEVKNNLGIQSFVRVFLYHTDGYITEWSPEEHFKHVPYDSIGLHPQFLKICLVRRNEMLGGMSCIS